ncbi:ABC transporter substrate-binding protein [Metabacillus arenae]|uniref:ABC transporter substrate-binding protein n=1 Tax=Metabacillus arenae TaxID=2771434 RepID=A0A926NIW1_9BACI|nr:ABC transporter substrate-binding protein [Metabacillus arenae]MBD1381895.1 ABC transporter substrate-binding protein [Metabacillus arenae]
MKVKFLSLLIICIVMVSSAACGRMASTEADGKIHLTYWTLFGGGDAEFMNEIVNKFNQENPNIYVNNVEVENARYYTKLQTAISAGSGPDISVVHTEKLPEFAKLGALQSLEKESVNWEEFNQNILESTIIDDKHYAIPIDTHPFVFYYNKKLLKEAGLLSDDGTPIVEESPEGLVSFFITLKEKLPEGIIPYSLSSEGSDPYFLWWALYHQLGGRGVISEDQFVLDKEKGVQAANYLKALFHKHQVIPKNLPDFYRTFQSQKAAVITTGVWATGIWESTEGLEFGVMAFPKLYEKQATWGDSHTLALPISETMDEEKKEAAIKFMKYASEQGAIWAKAGHIPVNDKVVESTEFNELPYRSSYVEVADTVAFPASSIHNAGVKDIVIKQLNLIWAGKASSKKAINDMEKEINELLKY